MNRRDICSIAMALAAAVLVGCGSQPTYTVSVPPAEKEFKTTGQRIDVLFKKSREGETLYKLVQAQGSYTGGNRESLESVRSRAIENIISAAINDVNGTVISAETRVRSKTWENSAGTGSLQTVEDRVLAQTIGLGKVVGSPDCKREAPTEDTVRFSCWGQVSVPVIERLRIVSD